MRIGIIGIGDIAKKAYLPVITRLRNVDIYAYTRNSNTLVEIKKEYKSINTVNSIEELISSNIDAVMIHSSTIAHYELSRKFLLLKIPVFVDKPISFDIKQVRELYDIAKENNTLFRVGFNRRKSSFVADTLNLKPDVIIYQKNRFDWPGELKDYIFTDFIHVVDTTCAYLQDEVIGVSAMKHCDEDVVHSLSVSLKTKSQIAHMLMYRKSGMSEEVIELFAKGKKYRITDLNSMIEYSNDKEIHHKLSDWLPTLSRRGFTSMVDEFLCDVSLGGVFDLKDEESLISHEICDKIYRLVKV